MRIYIFLGIAAIPFIYYVIVLYSGWRFFRREPQPASSADFTPPVSNLRAVRGLDPEAYENFASFCRQDYPEYEIIFCLSDRDDPAYPVVQKIIQDFPERPIRVVFNTGSRASNDKVSKLVRLTSEARYEHLVITDSDVRVRPDYFRTVMAPMANPKAGAVTCFSAPVDEKTFAGRLQTIGMISDFYAGIVVAWKLDGVKFAFGPTIATTRARLAEFGGYQILQNKPADDLLVGRLIADLGYEVELLPYTVQTIPDYQSTRGLIEQRLRWMVVMRHMRPWGHVGLVFTQGLPWCLAAAALHPTAAVVGAYVGGYLGFRLLITWMIGVHGLKQSSLWGKIALIPAWDIMALAIWLGSFFRNSIRWRDREYYIREGMLVPVSSTSAEN